MPWLKVDDGAWSDPWVVMVGNEAFGVYTRLASYCAQYLTDGLVPASIVAMVTADASPDVLERLENVGRAVPTTDERMPATGSLYLPKYLLDNPSRHEVESDRKARKERAEAAAAARWGANGSGSAPRRPRKRSS